MSPELWKVCTGCGLPRENGEFIRTPTGGLGAWCTECRKKRKEEGRPPWPGERTSKLKEKLVEFLGELSHGQSEAVTTQALVNGMLVEFGGLGRFCGQWFEILQEALDNARHKRGSYKVVLDQFAVIAKFIAAAEERRPKSHLPAGDKELDDMIFGMMITKLEEEGSDTLLEALAASRGKKLVAASPESLPAPDEPIPDGVPDIEDDAHG